MRLEIPRNQKGQVEAPFQLLIAAVMLGMLLPIAFYLFNQYQVWESQERISNNLETLARELETVASLGEGTKYIDIDLSVYGSKDLNVRNFTLLFPDEEECMKSCYTPRCLIIRPQTEEGYLVAGIGEKCARLPFNIDFKTTGCSNLGHGYSDLATGSTPGQVGMSPGFYRLVAIKRGMEVYLCKVE